MRLSAKLCRRVQENPRVLPNTYDKICESRKGNLMGMEASNIIVIILCILLGLFCCLIVPAAAIVIIVLIVKKNKQKKEAEQQQLNNPEYTVGQPDEQK